MTVDEYLELATLMIKSDLDLDQLRSEVEHLRLRASAVDRLPTFQANTIQPVVAVLKPRLRGPRTCAVCHIHGHDRRNCPQIYGENNSKVLT